jgi:hypothetical protein
MDACLDLGRRVLGRCPTSSRILIQGEKPEDISSIHQDEEKEIEDRFAMSSFLENLTIVVFVEEAKKGKDGIDEDVKGLEKERQVSMVKMNAVD